jgi:hypothetical protein
MLPNILTQFTVRSPDGRSPALILFLLSLLQNYALGCLLSAASSPHTPLFYHGLFGLSIFLLFTVLPLDSLFSRFRWNHFVLNQLWRGLDQNLSIFETFTQNLALAPVIGVEVVAGHYESVTRCYPSIYSGGKFKLSIECWITTELRETFRESQTLDFGRWEGLETELVWPVEALLVSASFRVDYRLDETLKQELSNLSFRMKRLGDSKDSEVTVKRYLVCPGMIESVTGTFRSVPAWLGQYGGWRGVFVWWVVTLLGYQSVYESVWFSNVAEIEVVIPKRVLM